MTLLFFWQPRTSGAPPAEEEEPAPPFGEIGGFGRESAWGKQKKKKLRAIEEDLEDLRIFAQAAVERLAADLMNSSNTT